MQKIWTLSVQEISCEASRVFVHHFLMNQISAVLARFGNVREAADKIGRAPSVIQYWRSTGRIPATAQASVLEAGRQHGVAIEPFEVIPGPEEAA
jgi:hypothetical protein